MIRGHDSGYDSKKCNMHVVINFVYAISGNTHGTGPMYWKKKRPVLTQGGPLPFINGVITPINGLING